MGERYIMISQKIGTLLLTFGLLIAAGCDSSDDPMPAKREGGAGTIETFAGQGPTANGYDGDGGLATQAKVSWVVGVGVDNAGNVYFTDGASNTVRMVRMSDDVITTVAGKFRGWNINDPEPSAGDGSLATTAHLHVPIGVSVDQDNNIYISDAGNFLVRKVSAADKMISTFAGKRGLDPFSPAPAPATSVTLWNPHGVAVDADGNIFISDTQNNVIRRVDRSTGEMEIIAGLGPDQAGYSGDSGPANQARLKEPTGIAIGPTGIYFADAGNNVIRKISNGIITTIAGTGELGYSGDNGSATGATFKHPLGIAVDKLDNLYIADVGNNVIRKVAGGIITTVAGNGSAGYSGDGFSATQAQLSGPWGVAVDNDGNLYIADTGNAAIRIVYQ